MCNIEESENISCKHLDGGEAIIIDDMTPQAYEEASGQLEPQGGCYVRPVLLPDLARATRHAQMCHGRSPPEVCMRPQAGRRGCGKEEDRTAWE